MWGSKSKILQVKGVATTCHFAHDAMSLFVVIGDEGEIVFQTTIDVLVYAHLVQKGKKTKLEVVRIDNGSPARSG